MRILVLNAGSSSLKFDLFDAAGDGESELLKKGVVEHVGPDQTTARAVDDVFAQIGSLEIGAVGHRVVHGGVRFAASVVIDEAVEQEIERLSALAPLHNPRNLEAMRAARRQAPAAVQVAVFDTAFHRTIPEYASSYALPPELGTDRGIHRYGFHGISHRYVSGACADLLGRPLAELRVITSHLGNGCSVCAVEGGRSIDTSMGFTPLEGLVMGTRCGDIDAGAVLELIRSGIAPEEVGRRLNEESGLLGLSGISGDMRDLEAAAAAGDKRAALAIEVFSYRVKKYIGSYFAAMNGCDALVFTGGIGEHSSGVRRKVCTGLAALGIEITPTLNETTGRDARQIGFGTVPVWVIPTNEELLIARDALRLAVGRQD